MADSFNIPVCLIIFKRADTTVKIIEQIAKIKPSKLYLLADQGRNEEERKLVSECRKAVEQAITWPCEVIKYYAEENRGVYENIAGGAKYVFAREKWAIFLEDDNYPALSFFEYCCELLKKYENNSEIFGFVGQTTWNVIRRLMVKAICLQSIYCLVVGHLGLLNLIKRTMEI